jgi:putative transposase
VPRRARVIIPGAPHHVTQRGNNRQPVFRSAACFQVYLDLLARHAVRCGVRILGYCLMPNHVHVIAVPERETSLARAFGRAHSEYALAENRETERTGHLWQNRYFSCCMDGSHLLKAMCYVELNPVRAKLVANAWEWPWSSARAHTVDNAMDAVLGRHGEEYFGGWNSAEWKEILSARMSADEAEAVRRATRTGEPLGSRGFLAEMERQTGKRLRVLERGRPKNARESAIDVARQGSLFEAVGK